MSVYYHQPTASTSSMSSDQSSHRPLRSKFREHLSIQVPPPVDFEEIQIERSKFSPESPPPPFKILSTLRRSSIDKKEKFKERDLEAGPQVSAAPPRSGRLTRFLFDARTLFGFQDEQGHLKSQESYPMPMQDLPSWPPLHIAKHPHPHPADAKETKRRRRNRCLLFLLIIIILCLAGTSTFSLVRILSLHPSTSSTSTSATTSATQRDISACLSQYTLNAPISPSSFPCSTCAPLFSPAPTSPALSSVDNSTATALLQFCALADIFTAASTSSQANLTNPGGWLKDTNFCGWAGVGCSDNTTAGTGVVTSLQLTTPGIPSVLSESFGQLTALETFALEGSGALPAGAIPASFAGLVNLKAIHIQDTSLTWNDATGIANMPELQTVVLMQNAKMTGLPSGLTGSSIQGLIINNQPLPSTAMSDVANSASLQSTLQLLDLSSTPLNTTLPSLASFAALTELQLDNTGLAGPLPGAGDFAPGLTVLSMSGNPGLSVDGGIGGACVYAVGSTALQTCTLGGTGLSAPAGGCGVCTF
ncbi:hypothetical protein HWV62_6813 [Athelia sp. TMB]|nr:hypothetical protein HWV62_6813 [Athelia sp. TMB]